ncbi:FtsX-like permease family protein [Pacificibacter marinus]|uniref:FtsX-like permease family protein n=1 Tax=Pacificibacter marinus TaxID=658057 RepID=UPI001C07C266|nr:FtsX-like permease family protein [Pacificibacter marinus]MBU2867544.1 FtsX-like permease family protein [Pacificibacter marinus]
MSHLLTILFGRLPIGWLQLTHSRGRFFAAVAGVAFANLLVFMQLGIMGALNNSTVAPYDILDADIILSSQDGNTLTDGGHIPRARMFQALGVAGVSDASALFIGNLPFTLEDGSSVSLLSFGMDVAKPLFATPAIATSLEKLSLENTVLLDEGTRGMPKDVIAELIDGGQFRFETGGNTLTAIGTMDVGVGFLADGMMIMSDQSFMRVFPGRSSGAPNHILIRIADGVSNDAVVARLMNTLPSGNLRIQTKSGSAANDLAYMATERPTGVIFGFGVFMGLLVGLVIVYQVLSTDVADHLREYATFKAMGYGQSFFLGIVFEEAIILALFGFIPGILVSLGLYAGLVSFTGLPVEMNAGRALLVFFGTLMACSLSGAIATRRLANADPADLF